MRFDNTIQQILDEYGDNCQSCEINGEYYIFKLMTLGDYKLINSLDVDEFTRQDIIVERCILFPINLNIDDMFAGDVMELCKLIINQSCLSLDDRLILTEMYRQEMEDLDAQMQCVIVKAFPSYTFDMLEKLSFPELHKIYSRAEWILECIEGLPIKEFIDPYELINNAIEPTEDYKEIEENVQPQQKERNILGRKLDDVLEELQQEEKIPINQKRKQMTPEEEKAFLAFQNKFPDLNMQYDAMFTGSKTQTGNIDPVAKRTPNQIRKE